MTIRELLPQLGITKDIIVDIIGEQNLGYELKNGYEIRRKNIKTGKAVEMVSIHPNILWTDSCYRPYWTSGFAYGQVTLCLSKSTA
jgi:hypothetical protein